MLLAGQPKSRDDQFCFWARKSISILAHNTQLNLRQIVDVFRRPNELECASLVAAKLIGFHVAISHRKFYGNNNNNSNLLGEIILHALQQNSGFKICKLCEKRYRHKLMRFVFLYANSMQIMSYCVQWECSLLFFYENLLRQQTCMLSFKGDETRREMLV